MNSVFTAFSCRRLELIHRATPSTQSSEITTQWCRVARLAPAIKLGPGLVAFYDIRPGNGEGLFLQPRNPYGAQNLQLSMIYWVHFTDYCIRLSQN